MVILDSVTLVLSSAQLCLHVAHFIEAFDAEIKPHG